MEPNARITGGTEAAKRDDSNHMVGESRKEKDYTTRKRSAAGGLIAFDSTFVVGERR